MKKGSRVRELTRFGSSQQFVVQTDNARVVRTCSFDEVERETACALPLTSAHSCLFGRTTKISGTSEVFVATKRSCCPGTALTNNIPSFHGKFFKPVANTQKHDTNLAN